MSHVEPNLEELPSSDGSSAQLSGITNGDLDEEIKELTISYDAELSHLPHILEFLERLKTIIRRQQKKIKKLKVKLKDNKPHTHDVYNEAQPETFEQYANVLKQPPPPPPPTPPPPPQPSSSSSAHATATVEEDAAFAWGDTDNLLEEVTQAAEEALQTQAQTSSGFVYEPTSGMYYDYSTGYYYNPVLRMYYDGNSGNYLVFDEKTQQYTFADLTAMEKIFSDRKKQSEKIIGVKRERGEEAEDGEIFDAPGSVDVLHRPRKKGKSRWKRKAWPPCLRLMVLSTAVPGIGIGSLFLVTCEGGSVGREGNREVLLPEPSVSKVHIRVSFNGETYQVFDVGSRNGTFLNGKRLTPALKESEEPVDITHGDELQIGSTMLSVHVHSGRDTCEGCEPGLQLMPTEAPKESAPLPSRRDVLKSLKKRYGVEQPIEAEPKEGENYTDRAEKRRIAVGSSHHAEKTETACLSKSISSENKGFKMLSKMGWKEGKSLGKNEQGMAEPVPIVSNVGATGLGAQAAFIVSETKASRQKKKVLKTTQERYNQQPIYKGDVNDH